MIPITGSYFAQAPPAYHILNPWWDIFTNYISIVMLMVAVFGGTLQVTQDKMSCLPCNWVDNKTCEAMPIPNRIGPYAPKHKDNHQYNYINAVCYYNELHWFAKYFPYLVLLHTLIFLVCSNFWFKFPRTCSKLEHFVSILLKCFDSPWTSRALSKRMVKESKLTPPGEMNGSTDKNLSVVSDDVDAPVPVSSIKQGTVDRRDTWVLDKTEGEQAKALFERVKNFRVHAEGGDIIYTFYVRQTIIKVINFALIISYTAYFVQDIRYSVVCTVNIQMLTGYNTFYCAHPIGKLFKILAFFYILLVLVYGLICIYTLCWVLGHSLKRYSFESVREESSYSDVPDLKNDLAFMLHLIDLYDPLYSKRLAVFLSEVSENKLRQLNLKNERPLEKPRRRITKNSQDKLYLHLSSSGFPENRK